MALDESVDKLQQLESNGVNAYIDPNLYKQLENIGNINIDYITNEIGQSGYRIVVGNPDCSSSGCRGC